MPLPLTPEEQKLNRDAQTQQWRVNMNKALLRSAHVGQLPTDQLYNVIRLNNAFIDILIEIANTDPSFFSDDPKANEQKFMACMRSIWDGLQRWKGTRDLFSTAQTMMGREITMDVVIKVRDAVNATLAKLRAAAQSAGTGSPTVHALSTAVPLRQSTTLILTQSQQNQATDLENGACTLC